MLDGVRFGVTRENRRKPGDYSRRIPLDLTSACWDWHGVTNDVGYPMLTIDGKKKYAHRMAYVLHVGPIRHGWELDRVCHTEAVKRGECPGGLCAHRRCWNPAHLEAVSSRENSMRGTHPLFSVARALTCRRGHDLSKPENVRLRSDGRVRCRPCAMDGVTRRRREKRGSS